MMTLAVAVLQPAVLTFGEELEEIGAAVMCKRTFWVLPLLTFLLTKSFCSYYYNSLPVDFILKRFSVILISLGFQIFSYGWIFSCGFLSNALLFSFFPLPIVWPNRCILRSLINLVRCLFQHNKQLFIIMLLLLNQFSFSMVFLHIFLHILRPRKSLSFSPFGCRTCLSYGTLSISSVRKYAFWALFIRTLISFNRSFFVLND